MAHREMLLQCVINYLDSEGLHYEVKDREKGVIRFAIKIDCKLQHCDFVIIVGENDVQFISVCPLNASEDSYANVVEYLTRANYGLRVGNFEFDYTDGEIRYQCCLVCDGALPSSEEIDRCVTVNLVMMGRYGDGLVKNIMGYGNPAEDIAAIEGK